METFVPMYGKEYKEDTGNEAIVDDLLDIGYVEWLETVVWEEAKRQCDIVRDIQIPFTKDMWFPQPGSNPVIETIKDGDDEALKYFKDRFYEKSKIPFSRNDDSSVSDRPFTQKFKVPLGIDAEESLKELMRGYKDDVMFDDNTKQISNEISTPPKE
jgi:hypothetical protein